MKRASLERLEAEAARELTRLGEAGARREAMHTAVAEVIDALEVWRHGDMSALTSTTHDYARGEYLSRHLVTLVEMLIAADRAAGGNGTGDKKLVERLPERKQECMEAHAKVVKLARALVALPVEPSPVTIDAARELGYAANNLWSKLHWLADWTRELGELRGGPAPAKTIHDDLANVIDLERRRAELAPRGEP